MKSSVKAVLKKVPLLPQFYAKLRSAREAAQANRLFVNPEVFFQALREKGEGTVRLETRDGLNITIRQNIWDAKIIKENFIEKPYVRHFTLPENPIVIDVGGYIGDFSLFAAKYLNAKQVIVFEPTDENFKILKQNITNNNLEDIIVPVNKAVSNTEEIKLNVEKEENEEVHVSAYWYPEAEHRVVPAAILDDVLKAHHLDRVDLLKVDCEGGEYDIFPSLSPETYRRIDNIVFEYHEFDGYEEKFDKVKQSLKAAGYKLRVEGFLCYASRA